MDLYYYIMPPQPDDAKAPRRSTGGSATVTTARSSSDLTTEKAVRRRSSYEEKARTDAIVRALALRSFHLPGYSWCADWCQYFFNNHPVFGIFLHHRLHPIGMGIRVVALLGSIFFGLAITSIIYLWFVGTDRDMDSAVISLSFTTNVTNAENFDASVNNVTVTSGMLTLWTVGGGLHALFDNSVWFIAACSCCQPGGSLETLSRFARWGNYIVVFIVVIVAGVATLAVVLRATIEDDATDVEIEDFQLGDIQSQSFSFIAIYLVELSLAFFVYYPLIQTLLFTGVLGCGTIPFLGGRPREVALEILARERGTSPV